MNLDRIMARVEIDGDCWTWTGPFAASGTPQIYSTAKRGSLSVRRVAYELTHGPLSAKRFATFGCDNEQCINPAHTKIVSRSLYMKRAVARGAVHCTAIRAAKIALSRQKQSKIDMATARQIRLRRAAGESGAALALEFGVSQDTVCLIHMNKQWRDFRGLAVLAAQMGML